MTFAHVLGNFRAFGNVWKLLTYSGISYDQTSYSSLTLITYLQFRGNHYH